MQRLTSQLGLISHIHFTLSVLGASLAYTYIGFVLFATTCELCEFISLGEPKKVFPWSHSSPLVL